MNRYRVTTLLLLIWFIDHFRASQTVGVTRLDRDMVSSVLMADIKNQFILLSKIGIESISHRQGSKDDDNEFVTLDGSHCGSSIRHYVNEL